MPNKFMAIDIEMQNGLITEAEAVIKRQIDEESQFYGSMDGASSLFKAM